MPSQLRTKNTEQRILKRTATPWHVNRRKKIYIDAITNFSRNRVTAETIAFAYANDELNKKSAVWVWDESLTSEQLSRVCVLRSLIFIVLFKEK